MARLEYKYYIPLEYLDSLRRELLPFLVHDKFTNQRTVKEYTVRSIYLDTPDLLTYNQKLDGIKKRNKFRIRGYNEQTENSMVFLEIKRKYVDHISKDRAPILYSNLESFIESNDISLIMNSSDDTLQRQTYAGNFLYYFHFYNLRPRTLVVYEREAMECKFGSGLRVTFDKNIRVKSSNSYSDLYTNEKLIPATKNQFVLEIKFRKIIPRWLPVIMKKYNIIRESVPKYAISVDSSLNNILAKFKN